MPKNECGQGLCGEPARIQRLPDFARNRSEAAFVLAVSGSCAVKYQASMLAATAMLLATRPAYETVVMLADECADDAALAARIAGLGARPLPLPHLQNVSCRGPKYAQGLHLEVQLNATEAKRKGGNYFEATYTKLRAWGLTRFRAVLSIDNDVAVLRNLDGLLDTMLLNNDEVRELRTPQGCLPQKDAHSYLNTGLWGLRPSGLLWEGMYRELRRGRFSCGVGDQTSAMQYFGDDRRLNKRGTRSSQTMSLHAGYNLKANIGAISCLSKLQRLRVGPGNHSADDLAKNGADDAQLMKAPRVLHLVDPGGSDLNLQVRELAAHAHAIHWSGSRKPATLVPGTVRDPIERRALSLYMREYSRVMKELQADKAGGAGPLAAFGGLS